MVHKIALLIVLVLSRFDPPLPHLIIYSCRHFDSSGILTARMKEAHVHLPRFQTALKADRQVKLQRNFPFLHKLVTVLFPTFPRVVGSNECLDRVIVFEI